MPVEIGKLRDDSNIAILNNIRAMQTDAYQSRIPEATKTSVNETIDALHRHKTHYNEFIDALVNRIGSVISRNMVWTNPLSEFKRGMLEWGDTIEEIQSGLLKAYTYDPDRDYMEKVIWGRETPDVQTQFHKVNRQDMYKMTINDALLKRAFLDPSGLSNFISQLLQAPITSDNWDEFILTTSLFAKYNDMGGFYNVNVEAPGWNDSDDAASRKAKNAIRKIRAMSETLKFPSTKYNAAGMPTFINPADTVMFTTPEFAASIDVEALAAAFNIDKSALPSRIVTIPDEYFNMPGTQAILTSSDFFVIADNRIENTSIQNPASLHHNYFFHHWEVVSMSRFVPAIRFSVDRDDEVIHVTNKTTSIGAITVTSPVDGSTVSKVVRGGLYQLDAKITSVNADAENRDGLMWSVAGAQSPRTHVSATGVLSVGPDEDAETITVQARSVNDESVSSVKKSLGVEGDKHPQWPVKRVATGDDGDELPTDA